MEEEIWKDIKGYEGLYKISNLGRLKSLEKIHSHTNRIIPEKIIKLRKNITGYIQVILWKNGKYKPFYLHRLVANSFIKNNDNKPFIDHINRIRDDNRVSNLRWVTMKENMNNPLTLLAHPDLKGEKSSLYGRIGILNHQSKHIIQLSLNGEYIQEWFSISDIKRSLNFQVPNISRVCKGKAKQYKGYIWLFYNDWIKIKPLLNGINNKIKKDEYAIYKNIKVYRNGTFYDSKNKSIKIFKYKYKNGNNRIPVICIKDGLNKYTKSAAKIIAECFIEYYDENIEIQYRDGDMYNIDVENILVGNKYVNEIINSNLRHDNIRTTPAI